MNNAGLPGTGLGGLFYILLALWMPLAELYRTARGRSSPARWRQVATQFALACGIVAALVAAAAGYLQVIDEPSPWGARGPAVFLGPVALAAVLLTILVVVLRVWARFHQPADQPADPRELVGSGADRF